MNIYNKKEREEEAIMGVKPFKWFEEWDKSSEPDSDFIDIKQIGLYKYKKNGEVLFSSKDCTDKCVGWPCFDRPVPDAPLKIRLIEDYKEECTNIN